MCKKIPYDVRIKNRLIVPPACHKRRLKGIAAGRASGVKLCSINMQTSTQNTILDRSGPRIKTAATSVIAQQGAGGNRAAVGNSRRGGAKARQKWERKRPRMKEMKVGTLNIGTMTGRGREVADMMERRGLSILCVQETRWKELRQRS